MKSKINITGNIGTNDINKCRGRLLEVLR